MYLHIKDNKDRFANSQLFQDSMWALIGSVLGKGLSLLAGIAVARFLGKEAYGEYGMIKNTLVQIAIFSTLGLGYTGTRYIASAISEDVDLVKRYVKIIYQLSFIASFILAVCTFCFSQEIANYIDAPETSFAFRLTAFIVIANAVNTAQIGILSGFKAFKTIANNNVLGGVVTFVLSVLLTYFYSLDGALIALLISMMFNAFINMLSIKTAVKAYPSTIVDDTKGLYKDLISFSIPVALQESLYSVVGWAMSLLLIKMANYGELGLYTAAAQWSSIVLFVPGVLKNVILSHFSSSPNHFIMRKRMLLINFFATFVPFLIISACSSFVSRFYGQTFATLPLVLIISCAGSIFSSISSVIIYEFIAKKKTWFVFFARFIRDLSILGLSYLLLSHSGISGAVAISSSSVVVYALFMVFLLLAIKRESV